MKAKRAEPKQEFVPVIVTLESQEEVDAFFCLCNHGGITRVYPALNGWWSSLTPFRSRHYSALFDKLINILK